MQGTLTVLRYIPHTPLMEHVVKTNMHIREYEEVLQKLVHLYPGMEVMQVYCVLPGNENKNNSK